jgi:hypothetical protein
MSRMDWRKIARDCARDTILNVRFWVNEAVIVLAGIAFLHNLNNPQTIRVPFLILGLG